MFKKNCLPILTPDYSTLAEKYSFKPQTKQLALNMRGAVNRLSGCRLGCRSLGKHATPQISDREFQQSLNASSTLSNKLLPVKAGYCYCINEESLS